MSPWNYYSVPLARFKLVAIVLICAVLFLPQAGSAGLIIESGPGQLSGVHWESFRLDFPGNEPGSGWTFTVAGLNLDGARNFGEIELICHRAPRPVTAGCFDGQLDWRLEGSQSLLGVPFTHRRESGLHHFVLHDEHWQVELEIPEADSTGLSVEVTLDRLDLSQLPAMVSTMLQMNMLYGALSGQLSLEAGQVTGQLALAGGGFDSLDGLMAADGLELEIDLKAGLNPLPESLSISLVQTAGELLFGSLYLPPPKRPLNLELDARFTDKSLDIERFSMVDPDALELIGSGILVRGSEGWLPERATLESAELDFPLGWTRWMDGQAAAAGFGDLTTDGRVRASLDWHVDRPLSLQAELVEVMVDDPRDRAALADVNGRIDWNQYGPEADLSWDALELYGLRMSRSRLAMSAAAGGVHLDHPLRLPLLDGAIVIDQLLWTPMDRTTPGFGFDARIEPLDLTELTRALSWPEFGGVLSGEFPGVVLVDDMVKVTGSIDIQAFSGQIRLTELAIERPFGTLPALSTQVEFSRLDLLELTGAFNFGSMHGQMSGWMRDLRLLDWRPVAMDARVFTHEDAPRRRISQRAVDNLSSLGGGGGALISGTVLWMFEDFPYRRAGLACRLSNNICHVDGVASHESGGFYIVEGRALPRLDIVGHRRLVDWQRLIRQLGAMVE